MMVMLQITAYDIYSHESCEAVVDALCIEHLVHLKSEDSLKCKDSCYRFPFIELPITCFASIPLEALIMIFWYEHVDSEMGTLIHQ